MRLKKQIIRRKVLCEGRGGQKEEEKTEEIEREREKKDE
jgi:hypothetical protein